jgi:diadenylate cyclase
MVLVVLGAFVASQILPFRGFTWLLSAAIPGLLVAIPVIFQPELRRALERLGRTGRLWARRHQEEVVERLADEIVRAAHHLSTDRHGALIVFERETGLQDVVETGVAIDSDVRAELIQTIFHPNTPLHDKAVIVREGRIVAASCMLPATNNPQHRNLGTRHRAAVGVTEESDALALVVSEETGAVSVAYGGQLLSRLDTVRLRNVLLAFLQHRLGGRGWTERV